MTLRSLSDWFVKEWDREQDIHMKKVAHQYYLRSQMDGEVVKKTGEVVPKESV